MRFDLLVLDDAHHLADSARWRCSPWMEEQDFCPDHSHWRDSDAALISSGRLNTHAFRPHPNASSAPAFLHAEHAGRRHERARHAAHLYPCRHAAWFEYAAALLVGRHLLRSARVRATRR